MEIQCDDVRKRLVDDLTLQTQKFSHEYPIAEYIRDLRSFDPYAGYRRLPGRVVDQCRRIVDQYGPESLEQYHRLLLATLLDSIETRLSLLKIPAALTAQTLEFASRILEDVKKPRRGYFQHENDRFAKDLAVCRLKLLVCGPEVVDLHSGFPRSYLGIPPRTQILTRALFFARATRGFRPFYETHMDRRLIKFFSPEGYSRCYRSLAELLAMNPGVKGVMFGASWFVDPKLDEISPELSYLRTVPTENGARLFPAPTTERAMRDAVRLSPIRQRLFNEGKYTPQSYIIVWPRQSLIDWSYDHAIDT